jgi:hypothetical protein
MPPDDVSHVTLDRNLLPALPALLVFAGYPFA